MCFLIDRVSSCLQRLISSYYLLSYGSIIANTTKQFSRYKNLQKVWKKKCFKNVISQNNDFFFFSLSIHDRCIIIQESPACCQRQKNCVRFYLGMLWTPRWIILRRVRNGWYKYQTFKSPPCIVMLPSDTHKIPPKITRYISRARLLI